jgi:hypothetical protein
MAAAGSYACSLETDTRKTEPQRSAEEMTRAFDDKTSTCGSCSYWEHDKSAGDIPRTGWCQYASVPAWVWKHLKPADSLRKMQEGDGLECWQHTKRASTEQFESELERRKKYKPGPGGQNL